MLYLLLFFIIAAIIYLIYVGRKYQQHKKKALITTLIIITIVNLLALPMSFFIGVMATDAPDSTFSNFLMGFFFIQGLPLLSYLILFFFKNKKPEQV